VATLSVYFLVMQDNLRFILNGQTVQPQDLDPHTTLLEFVREERRLTGTKEGCAEGDCGACTVVLGELVQDAGGRDRVALAPINACIRLLPTLDGKAVFTVEALKAASGALHPVQQAMVDCHGSQCGFCTPGFVMALFALFKNDVAPSRARVCEAISGNLCRCTGYRPILDAAQRMYAQSEDVEATCQTTTERWLFEPATGGMPLLPGEAELAQKLRALVRTESLTVASTGGRFLAPRDIDTLSAAILANPDAWILGGCTDIGLWVTKALQTNPLMIYTGEVAELKQIGETGQGLRIGAAVPLERAFRAMNQHYPELAHVWSRFASWPIRASGTLGGNVANGSPIGDSMPALIALGATVVLRCGQRQRTLGLEDLYVDYRKQSRVPGEWVEAIVVPVRAAAGATQIASYKNSKRNEQDISAVCAAIAIAVDHGVVSHCRIAYGGMAGTPRRATHVEQALLGKAWTEPSVRAAMEALTEDFSPMSDMRASAAYRMQVAQNLLLRFWLECDDASAPVRVL
jgi:xanthine dehydrogenase small subunit